MSLLNFSTANSFFAPTVAYAPPTSTFSTGTVTHIANQASEMLDNFGSCGFFQSIVDGFKSFCKNIRESSFFSWIFDFIQYNSESRSVIDKAKCRNNSCTPDELIKYHKDLEFTNSNPNGIYKSHFAPLGKAKTQVYLLLGHCQGFKDKEEETGVLRLYNKLVKDNDCDVVLFRVGCAMTDLKHVSGLSKQTDLKPEVVKEHVANIIEDRNHSRGIFSGLPKPANVVITGYSWGAGLSKEILDRWKKVGNDTTVSTSMSLDAVQYGVNNFANSLKERPANSKKHINIFQNNDLFINGSNLKGIDPSKEDASVDVDKLKQGTSLQHTEIDDDPNVIDSMYREIRQSVINSPSSCPGKLILQKV
jgi:hypothetical protein